MLPRSPNTFCHSTFPSALVSEISICSSAFKHQKHAIPEVTHDFKWQICLYTGMETQRTTNKYRGRIFAFNLKNTLKSMSPKLPQNLCFSELKQRSPLVFSEWLAPPSFVVYHKKELRNTYLFVRFGSFLHYPESMFKILRTLVAVLKG